MDHFQRLRVCRVADGLSDGDVRNTGDHDNVSCFRLVHSHPLQSSVYEYLIDLLLFDLTVSLGYRHSASRLDNTFCDPADPQSSNVIIVSQSRDLQLQRFRVAIRVRLGVLDDSIEQRRDVKPLHTLCTLLDLCITLFYGDALDVIRIIYHDALSCDAVEDREIQLLVVGFQIHKELVHLINDFVDPGILLVDLVDEKNRIDPLLQRFFQYESRLRHRSFAGIHQQDDRVYRLDDTLHFRRKVGVSRCVYDIDLHVSVHDGTVF